LTTLSELSELSPYEVGAGIPVLIDALRQCTSGRLGSEAGGMVIHHAFWLLFAITFVFFIYYTAAGWDNCGAWCLAFAGDGNFGKPSVGPWCWRYATNCGE